jgi:hypothetical protein
MNLNIDILKIQYELFDLSPEAIAIANQVPTSHIEALIEDLKWTKNPLITKTLDISEVKDLTTVTEEYVSQLKDKLNIVSLLKQEILNPTYTKFETLLVYKAIEVVEKLDSEKPNAAKDLKIITSILAELLQNNANLTSAKEAVDGTDNKVVVQIMNQVEKAA